MFIEIFNKINIVCLTNIFEVNDKYVDEFGAKVAQIMSSVVNLNVPLVVNYKVAKNWGELK